LGHSQGFLHLPSKFSAADLSPMCLSSVQSPFCRLLSCLRGHVCSANGAHCQWDAGAASDTHPVQQPFSLLNFRLIASILLSSPMQSPFLDYLAVSGDGAIAREVTTLKSYGLLCQQPLPLPLPLSTSTSTSPSADQCGCSCRTLWSVCASFTGHRHACECGLCDSSSSTSAPHRYTFPLTQPQPCCGCNLLPPPPPPDL
jgi:hypothetical protein